MSADPARPVLFVEAQKAQDVKVLQFQNNKLSEQLEANKARITALEQSVAQAEEKERQHTQTLLCVNRLWEQLSQDISSLAERAAADAGGDAAAIAGGGGGGGGGGDEDAAAAAAAAAALKGVSDPFLRRLLSRGAAEALEDAEAAVEAAEAAGDDLSDVERALEARASATLAALAHVLGLLQSRAGGYPSDLAAAVASADAADAALRAENARLAAAAAAAAARADAASARRRALEAAVRQAEDRLFETEETMKSIKNDLADKEYELAAAQKKAQRAKQEVAQLKQRLAAGGGGGAAPAAAGAAAAGGSDGGALAAQPSIDSLGGGAAVAAAAAGAAPAAAEAAAAGGQQQQQQQQQEDALTELKVELDSVKEMLDQRTGDIESERLAHEKTKRELAEAPARLASDPSWVQQTPLYQAARREAERLLSELDTRAKERDATARDRDAALAQLAQFSTVQEQERQLRALWKAQGKQIETQQAKLGELITAKQGLETALAEVRARCGADDTVAELKTMVATLQKEVEMLQARLQKQQDLEARIVAARRGMDAAKEQAEEQRHKVARLHEALALRQQESSSASAREAELTERLLDLGAFVEVVTAYALDAPIADPEGLRKAEARARLEVASLKQQLEGHELQAQLSEARTAADALRKQLGAAADTRQQLQAEVARLGAAVASLQDEVEREKAASNAYIEEIVQASEAYENMQSQNTRLLQAVTEKDAAATALAAERLRLSQAHELLAEQLASAQAEAARLGAEQAEAVAMREAAAREAAKVSADLGAAREAARAAAARADALSHDLLAREEGLTSLRTQLEAASAAADRERRAREEEAEAAGRERAKRQRAEDEAKALQAKVARLRRSQDTAEVVQELETELGQVRKLLKCSVCCERQKNVIIKKCWHMFCKQCVDRVIEARSRKCPGCGHRFAEGDVQAVYLT